jgi:hypothetical protein
MVDPFQLALLLLVILAGLAGVAWLRRKGRQEPAGCEGIRRLAGKPVVTLPLLGLATFLGCLAVAEVVHEPIPRIPDEFSYLLLSDTFAHGHLTNPTPPAPEFFDTLHVLVRPTYASKYFPAQGLFLALGQKLTHHPAVGIWLSSALTCIAVAWMLQAWVGPVWGLAGGLLVALQWGIFSYWSQTYWGGMAAALGGALFLGGLRRLWARLSWPSAVWSALGVVILVNSRALEGTCLAVGVCAVVIFWSWWQGRRASGRFWLGLVLPAASVLLLGAAATMVYNRAVTGSAFRPPYTEHERQYQQVPGFIFQSIRPQIGYSNFAMADFYGNVEQQRYQMKRDVFPCAAATNFGDWWSFYCGVLFSLPLVIPVLLRRGWIRYLQMGVVVGLIGVIAGSHAMSVLPRTLVDLLVIVQIVLLWMVFDDFWPRLAIAASFFLLAIGFVTKWWFPHYSAPAAALVWFLQTEGLRRLWQCQPKVREEMSRRQRRQRKAEATLRSGNGNWLRPALRGLVFFFPLICALSLTSRVVLRKMNVEAPDRWPDSYALTNDKTDWSLRRHSLLRWLEQQPGPQLVFVRYETNHSFAAEWVYNDADLPHAKVVWAHDLSPEYNRRLLTQMPERKPWLLEADLPNPRMSPYSEANAAP